MDKGQLLYEGKAKRLFETDQSDVLIVEYKNDLTAFNGEKKAQEQGKGALNNQISSILFERLNREGISNHWLEQLNQTEQLVQHNEIIPIEVVVRNIAAGSLAKRIGLKEGRELAFPIVEYYYKDDDLGDPLINEDHIKLLNLVNQSDLNQMKEMALKVNDALIELFEACEIKLVDFKLEFGYDRSGQIILSDEVSPDTCRLWDIHTNEKLDKDVFRQGLGSVEHAYKIILNRLKGALSHG
ncbi:phosphoribosylaminoimidazolesuccinocarboxamide synthase [Filobacillus milosensis]|uniref:Phosphoribosylaminoimidazole-succinocarboxamide synthase n=1 Tax=Filobacillus milosensis TaxID=94137 RepID=A0A4Y8IEH9_9BACI|nr:phosphoribosylaminoimidazolesuccinocarboxamide synthase [Filobacillus milosensis]TFB14692.1 phosphoribosylaminoimidazolesuccinocarboxamide synthase [Filobacillus milosensis]